jgi:diguanylate cyclase (GGDEF)-like protein
MCKVTATLLETKWCKITQSCFSRGEGMFERPATLYDLIVVQNFSVLYRLRLLAFALAAGIYEAMAARFASGHLTGMLFLGWGVFTAFFYLRGRSSLADRSETGLFFQLLVDQIFLLLLIHATGGMQSPYLPIYALWLPLAIGLFPSKALPYLASLSILSLLFLLESYRLRLLQPYTPSDIPVLSNIVHYELIILSSMGAAFWLISNWRRSFERNWRRTSQLGRLLQLMTMLPTQQDARGLHQFELLLREICTLTRSHGAILAMLQADAVNLLGRVGPVAMVSPEQVSNWLAQMTCGNGHARALSGRAFYGVPLGGDGEFCGGLFLLHPQSADQKFIQTAEEVARVLAVALARYVQYQILREKVVLLDRLRDEIVHLTVSIQPQDVLYGIASAVRDLVKAQRLAIYTFQPDGSLVCSFASGEISSNYIEWVCRNHRALAEWQQALWQGYVAIADTIQDKRTSPQNYFLHQENIRAYLLLNLSVNGDSKGMLALYWDAPRSFSHQEIEIARLFAARAAEMLANAGRYDEALQAALTDELTGLPNRRALDRRLREEVRRSQRYERVFSFMMVDLDGFKKVNDQYGHPIGDSVLQQVAVLLRQNIRDTDFLARYGGDEFAVVLPETNRESAVIAAQKIRDVLEAYWLLLPNDQRRRMLSACVGIAVYPEDADNAKSLMQCADERLYVAKHKGHGTLVFQDPPTLTTKPA